LEKKKVSPPNYQTLADLTRLLEDLQPQLARQGVYLLLCFDEYEKLTPQIAEGALTGLPDALRYWIQHLPNFICLLAGTHPLSELKTVDWSDYLINVRVVPISYLDFDSALRLITKPVPEYDLRYEPPEIARELVHRCGGQPYLLQTVMFDLTEDLNGKNRRIAYQDDIENAIRKMFETAGGYFENLWNSEINEAERETLLAIANQKPLPTDSDKPLRSLIRKEILYRKDGVYSFCVPVIKEWILKFGD
jgi:hypothetical protein